MSNASGGYPVTPSNTDWLKTRFRDLNRKVSEANRGIREARNWASRVRYGTVLDDHTGKGSSPSMTLNYLPILLDGETTSIHATAQPTVNSGSVIWPGDRVGVIRDDGDGYMIVGKVMPRRYVIEALPSSKFRYYDALWQEASIYLADDGWVVWQGIDLAAVSIDPTSVLMVLPPELRPDIPAGTRIRFPVQVADAPNWVDIYADGTVKSGATLTALSSYFGFSGIMYPTAAAGSVWTRVAAQGTTGVPAFAGGFTDYSATDATFTPCRWTVDSYGLMHFQGMLKYPGTIPAGNTAVIALDAAHLPVYQHHFPSAANSGWQYWGADQGGTSGGTHAPAALNYKAGVTAANGNSTITGVRMPLQSNTITWEDARITNGWAWFGGVFPKPQIGRRGQFSITQGLVGSGTVGQTITPIPMGMRASGSIWGTDPTTNSGLLFLAVSADARGRIDIAPRGALIATQVSNQWVSMDGHVWAPEW
jgi:hypothetical protein